MPTELDQHIRTLVTRVVDLTPPAPDFPITQTVNRGRRVARWVPAAATLIVITTIVAGVAGFARLNDTTSAPRGSTTTIRLATIPQGVSWWKVKEVGRGGVFLERDGNDVTAFRNSAQHLRGEFVWWCPDQQVFEAPTHGERFDRDGFKLGGPARRGLDEYRVRRVGRDVTIDFDTITKGVSTEGTAAHGGECTKYSVGMPGVRGLPSGH